ncbi:MAG: hypothetical protein ACI8ZB_004542 [Desulforhopalus sp.]|jgi:hypothetical protein
MSAIREPLLFITAASMSLLWRFALTTTLAACLFITPFPFWAAVLCLSVGAMFRAFTCNRNWWVIQLLLLHLAGLGGVIAIIVHSSFDGPGYLPDFKWLTDMLVSEKTPLQWFNLFYMVLSSIWLWICGCSLVTKPRTHSNICQRFDAGTSCFFGLFLVRFLMDWQHDFVVNDSLSGALLIPFFIFSMLGLALAGNSSRGHKEFIPSYKGIGIILSFALTVLGIVAASSLLLQPLLKRGAETGLGAIKTVMEPLGPYFIDMILFLFAPRKTYQASQTRQANEGSSAFVLEQDSLLSNSTQEMFSYLFVAMVILLLLVAVLFLLWLLSRWLLSRTSAGNKYGDKNQPRLSFKTFIFHIFNVMARTVKWFFPTKKPAADELYSSLLGWGQYSGVPQLRGETPYEYGYRLQYHFHELSEDIQHIVNAFTKQIYGETRIPLSELELAQTAWRNMRSPRHWKMRIKMMVFGST